MKSVVIIVIIMSIGIIAVVGHFVNEEYQKQQKEITLQKKYANCVDILLTFDVAGNLNYNVRENNMKIMDKYEQCKIEYDNMRLDGWVRVDTPSHYESFKNEER